MANAYTATSAGSGGLGDTSLATNLVQTGYDKVLEFQLRNQPIFRDFADKRVRDLTNPGESVVLQLYNDLAESTPTALDEIDDPDSVAVPSTDTVTVTLEELGRTVIPTLKLRTFSLADIDPAVANILARDMRASLDNKVQSILRTNGTNVFYSNAGAVDPAGSTATIAAGDNMSASIVRTTVARLRSRSAVERMGDTFVALVHGDVALDLREETGEAAWNYPHAHSAAGNIWMGRVGVFGGASFVETPRCYKADDGELSETVYRSYFLGAQALAEVTAIEPHSVIGLPVDPMMRKRPLSWYGLLGWNVYRQEALQRVETASSISGV